MKCKVCVDRSCAACRKTKHDAAGPLRDGMYENATVVVRGGKIAALRSGAAVFHSFSDACAPPPEDSPWITENADSSKFLLQSTSCIAVTGKGNSSSPYQFNPVLNSRDFDCSPEGITLRHPPSLAAARTEYITSVTTPTPEALSIEVVDGVLSVGIGAKDGVLGRTRYTTFVRGICGGTYPVWINYFNEKYVVNVGTPFRIAGVNTSTPAALSFPDLETAIAAAEAITDVDDCARDVGGGQGGSSGGGDGLGGDGNAGGFGGSAVGGEGSGLGGLGDGGFS